MNRDTLQPEGNMSRESLKLGDVIPVHLEVPTPHKLYFCFGAFVPILIFMEIVGYPRTPDISPKSSFICKPRNSPISRGLLLNAKQRHLLLPKAKRKVFIGNIKIHIKGIIS